MGMPFIGMPFVGRIVEVMKDNVLVKERNNDFVATTFCNAKMENVCRLSYERRYGNDDFIRKICEFGHVGYDTEILVRWIVEVQSRRWQSLFLLNFVFRDSILQSVNLILFSQSKCHVRSLC